MRNWRHGWWQSKRVFQRDDPRFRRLQLIQTILVIMQVYLFLVGLMNIFVFYIPQMAVVDFVGVGIASVLLHFLKQTQAIDKIAWVTVIAVALILIVFMHLADGRNYALYWLTVLPPIAFFLLGRVHGLWVSLAFFGYCFSFIAWDSPTWEAAVFKPESLSNMILASVILILVFRHFEITRADTYRALEEKNRLLKQLSHTDVLTQTLNRAGVNERLLESLRKAAAGEISELAVALIDIDYFKTINDNAGHLVGDQVLCEVTKLLQQEANDATVGRWGGEEFILFTTTTKADDMLTRAEKIRAQIAAHQFSHGRPLTVSIGVTAYRAGDDLISILQRADDALYRAKEGGRNQVASSSG